MSSNDKKYGNLNEEQDVEEEQDKYTTEIINRYGNKSFKKADNIVKNMSAVEWENYQDNLDTLFKTIAKYMNNYKHDSKKIQKLIAKHYKLVGTLDKVTKNSYIELANLYSEHEDFIVFFDNYEKGFADFMTKSMLFFVNSNLK